MPYNNLKDINPSLKGIKPPITLEQANSIADAADKLEAKKVQGAWGIAIKQFKQSHTVRNKAWVERKKMAGKTKENETVTENHFLTQEVLDDEQSKECYGPDTYVPFNVQSFAQLKLQKESEDISEGAKEVTGQFVGILWNIMHSDEAVSGDKIVAVQNLIDEYMQELSTVLSPSITETAEGGDPSSISEESKPEDPISLTESFSGQVSLQEAVPGDVTYLDLQIIRPGWGNTHDNNFYPKEVLSRDASQFVGAKMYETDHREDEKSTRTWVSTIKEIKGFTEDGAPIARVAVHDPNFAQRLANLAQAGMIDKMECSILATGKVKRNFELGGRKGNMVEALTSVSSVDWVTRAGAGGKVLNLAEHFGNEIPNLDVSGIQELENELELIDRTDAEEKPEQPEQPATDQEVIPAEKPGETENSKPLNKSDVKEFLEFSRLPVISQKRLAESEYADLTALSSAIISELEYIKSVSGSGKPFGLSESENPTPKQPDMEEINRRKDAVNTKYLK